MRVLATTSRSFLRVDIRTRQSDVVHSGDGLYYGIAVAEERIFVAARRRMVSSDAPAAGEAGVIHVFDRALRHIETLAPPFPMRDLHGIAFDDGVLWATCSFDDMVARWDGTAWTQWYPLGQPVGEPRDVHHFNSLLFEGDTVWLLAHNRGPSELLGFARSGLTLRRQLCLGYQAHNIWREAGRFFTCSSADGRIVGEGGFELHTGGFPRGYVNMGGTRLVGLSELAERKARDFTSCVLARYDECWRLLDTMVLDKEGLLLDLACVDERQTRSTAAAT